MHRLMLPIWGTSPFLLPFGDRDGPAGWERPCGALFLAGDGMT